MGNSAEAKLIEPVHPHRLRTAPYRRHRKRFLFGFPHPAAITSPPTPHDRPRPVRAYARDNSQAAFTELVARHLDLGDSVARRHVLSSAAAEDIAQSVLITLARRGRNIHPGTPPIAWLHIVAHRTDLNSRRDEARCHACEQTAAEARSVNTFKRVGETLPRV